jgi:hypothetical protein
MTKAVGRSTGDDPDRWHKRRAELALKRDMLDYFDALQERIIETVAEQEPDRG